MDIEKQVLSAINESVSEAIRKRLTDYGSPLHKLIDQVIEGHGPSIRTIMSDAISGAMLDEDFRRQIKEQTRHKLARELVNSFGEGAFKKACDSMKSDPMIRSRCVLAIESIVNESMKAKI